MENSNSQSLVAAESFSYGWLTNQEPAVFHEKYSREQQQHSFTFVIPHFHTNDSVHADEIFSDGHILPFYAQRSQVHDERLFVGEETQFSPRQIALGCPPAGTRSPVYVLQKWEKSSKRILRKCLGFVKKIVGSRKSIRVDDFERKVCEIQRCSNSSLQATPRANVMKLGKKIDLDHVGIKRVKNGNSSLQQASPLPPRSSGSCYHDVEISIHEAILYCKRSTEK